MNYTYEQIKNAYQQKGYKYFDDTKPYNLNIWGVRKANGTQDRFDDLLGISCKDEQQNVIFMQHAATTDPGLYYLEHPENIKGTFIMCPGQYMGCWIIGMQNKQYPALVQKSGYYQFKGWRARKGDGIPDMSGAIYTDAAGVNMHTTSRNRTGNNVWKYSAGCQVRQFVKDHETAMQLIRKSAAMYGTVFSYTLFDEF